MALEEEWEAAGLAPEPESNRPVPWEDPALSRLEGFYRTLWDLLCRPGDFFQALGQGGRGEPLAFALIAGTWGLLAVLFWNILLLAAVGREAMAAGVLPGWDLGTVTMMAVMALAPVMVLASLGIGSLCLWAGAGMMGAAPGFTPIWRIYCYAQGGMALGVIPLFGAPLAAIWILILLYQGVHRALGVSPGQALAALVLSLILETSIWLVLLVGPLVLLALLGFLLL